MTRICLNCKHWKKFKDQSMLKPSIDSEMGICCQDKGTSYIVFDDDICEQFKKYTESRNAEIRGNAFIMNLQAERLKP